MNTLNFISQENSTIRFTTMLFPDGQPHIKIDTKSVETLRKSDPVKIITRLSKTHDLLLLLFAKNTLDYLEFGEIHLDISYLMTARMDRVMLEGEPFSLKVVAGILNAAGFKRINIFDPHSEVTIALIDRSYTRTNHTFVREAMDQYFSSHEKKNFCLVSPDAGALKKIHKLAEFLQVEDVVECIKERDLKTGALTNFKTADQEVPYDTCFIIDDICDGGGTFAGTAKMLKEKGAGRIVLIVSHGIFSKGSKIDYVDSIFTTDSYHHVPDVHCFPVEKYME